MNAPNEAEAAWLEQRRTGVGGSDAAASINQSPHMTALELYHIKVGSQLAPRDIDEERTGFGKLMENVIAIQYEKRYGVKLRRRKTIARHPKHLFMLATVDRLVQGQKRGVEIKNVDAITFRFNGEWGEPGSDQVPTAYLLQCAHYMAVLDYPSWDLAACIGGNRLEVYHIERDHELEAMLIEGERTFWQHVERHEPPEPDYGHAQTIPFLKRLYPGTNGETVHLPAEIEALHHARLDFQEQADLMQKGADAAKARIMHVMGEASVGLLPNGGGYTRKVVKRDGYTVDPTTYVDFRYSARKGEK